MSKLTIPLFLLACFVSLTHATTPTYKNPNVPVEQRVSDLLRRMTLAEKLGQLRSPLGWPMYSKSGDTIRLTDEFRNAMNQNIGCFYGVLRADPWSGRTLNNGLTPAEARSLTDSMQFYAVNHTRLGIPLFFAEEAVHGHMAIGATVMPTGLLQASTFDTTLMRLMGALVASELQSVGGNVAYGPVVDIARDPRWSRIEETMGEDPYLTGEIASAVVRGLQGTGDTPRVCSVLKHFAAYGIPEGGLNGEQANVGRRTLLDEYIPQFRRCIDAGACGIMTSYNAIDGTPCTANRWLLTDILRNQWGFSGMVFSDLISIESLANTHHVAHDYRDAALMALDAGVDIDLQGDAYALLLADSANIPPSTLAAIDTAVSRILRLKFRMGLFDERFTVSDERFTMTDDRFTIPDDRFPMNNQESGTENQEPSIPLQIARKGITLLKNDGILPLRNVRSIALIGPNADNIYNQLGDYTAPQPDGKVITPLAALRAIYPDVRYVRGCAIRDTSYDNIAEAVRTARRCDVTILVVGGSSSRYSGAEYMSTGAALVSSQHVSDMECGEGYDRASLRLMGRQERLMQALIDAHVPLVVVYIEGRPLDMNLAAAHANALLTAWYPGEMGGQALAEILSGRINPSGRLPVSIPRNAGQLPVHYSRRHSHDYIDSEQSPLYPFGYGLSYTTFAYSDIRYSNDTVSCTVTNTGLMDGDEVVQLYIKPLHASVTLPGLLLRGFTRVHIPAGHSVTVSLPLGRNQLIYTSSDLHDSIPLTDFQILIGPSSSNLPISINQTEVKSR